MQFIRPLYTWQFMMCSTRSVLCNSNLNILYAKKWNKKYYDKDFFTYMCPKHRTLYRNILYINHSQHEVRVHEFHCLMHSKKNMFPYKIEFCLCCPNKKAKHSFSPTHFMFHFLWPIDQLYQHLSTMTTLNINTSQESRSRWSVKPAKPASIEFTFCVRRESLLLCSIHRIIYRNSGFISFI